MPEPPLTPPDPAPDRRSPFEWSLAALRPADADVARPSFMYKAGQASRQKAVWLWQCVAGVLAILLVTGAIATVGLVQGERQQVAAALAEETATRARNQPARIAPEQTSTEHYPPAARPTVPTRPVTPLEQPAPAEIAAALERRRNILVGGLGLIPDAPTYAPEPRGVPSYPGVLAAPRVEKKAPPVEVDPDPIDPPPPPGL